MFFISLFAFLFCVLASITADTPGTSAFAFDKLSRAAHQTLHNEELARALASLQTMIEGQHIPLSLVKQKIELIKKYSTSAPTVDSDKRILLKVKQEQEYTQQIKLLAKIQTELERLEQNIQEHAQKKSSRGAPQSVCSTITTITSVMIPYTIVTSGHYCLADDISGADVAITIAASNVELSLDTHSISNVNYGVVVLGVSNVKISGMATFSNVAEVCVYVLNSEIVTIENISMNGTYGVLLEQTKDMKIKNCICTETTFGVATTNANNSKIQNCYFTNTSQIAIDCLDGTENSSITHCYFDNNTQDIVSPTTLTSSIPGILIDSCFMSTTATTSVDLNFITSLIISNTLICDTASGSAISINDSTDIEIFNCEILSPAEHGMIFGGTNRNVIVKNCEVLNAQSSGVTAQGLVEGTFYESLFASLSATSCTALKFSACESLRVAECICSALAQNPETLGTNGVVFDACLGFVVKNSFIQTNARSEDNATGSMLFLSNGCAEGTIQGCTLSSIQPNVANFAILVQGDTHSLRFTDNIVDGAYRGGIRLEGTKYSQISTNFIRGIQQGSGITLKETHGIAVIGNVVTNNDTHGIHLDKETKKSFVFGNTVSNNKKIGIKNNTDDGDENKIYHNFAINNHEKNYDGVRFVAQTGANLGSLENISN